MAYKTANLWSNIYPQNVMSISDAFSILFKLHCQEEHVFKHAIRNKHKLYSKYKSLPHVLNFELIILECGSSNMALIE